MKNGFHITASKSAALRQDEDRLACNFACWTEIVLFLAVTSCMFEHASHYGWASNLILDLGNKKQSQHKVRLVAVLEISIISHGFHQQMLFPRSRMKTGPQLFNLTWTGISTSISSWQRGKFLIKIMWYDWKLLKGPCVEIVFSNEWRCFSCIWKVWAELFLDLCNEGINPPERGIVQNYDVTDSRGQTSLLMYTDL